MVILPDGDVRFEFSDLAHDYGSDIAEKTLEYLASMGVRAKTWIDQGTGEVGRYPVSQKVDSSMLMDSTYFGQVCNIADQIKEEEEKKCSRLSLRRKSLKSMRRY